MANIKNGVLMGIADSDIIDGMYVIPKGVTSIGLWAFYGCKSLRKITIPDTVTSIGAVAFENCEGLQEITIPDGVASIGVRAFHGCKSLQKIAIPKGVTIIDDNVFNECESLQEIIIPDGVTSIEENTFKNCKNLQKITIPETVTYIGEAAFYGCESLQEITIPDGVISIGVGAFEDCGSLQKVTIPDGVISIGARAFENCESLQEITIPEGVTTIEDGTFFNCENLQKITIPESVTSIGNCAFLCCESLQEITIPEGVTSIGEGAFFYCESLQKIIIPEGVTTIEDETFCNCKNLQKITIPESVTSISNCAFGGCESLQEITIPEGVTNIGDGIFSGCENLTEVKFSERTSKSVLEELYSQEVPLDQRLMFGDDLERFEKLKLQANFSISSRDYEEIQMNIFYHRMIKSIGIEEVEKIVKIPDLTEQEIKSYSLEKDEMFQELYETKYQIQGNLGIALEIFKNINLGKYKNNRNEKNNAEMKIFKELNKILKSEEKATLSEIIAKSIRQAGYELQDLKEIEELEKKINGHLIKNNLKGIRQEVENSLTEINEEQGESIVGAQVEPVRIMIEDAVIKLFRKKGELNKEELEQAIEEKIGEAGAPYIRQNKDVIVKRVMGVLGQEEIVQKLNHSVLMAMKDAKEQIGGAWKYKINKALQSIGYTVDNFPENLTQEQIQKIEQILNSGKQEKQINIQTTSKAVLKEGKDREQAYKLLQEKGMPKIITYKQIHDMFGSIHEPYSEEFKEFFKKHREEFWQNPEYIVEFGRIHNNFEETINSSELKNIYQKGKLTIDNILGFLNSRQFDNQREGDEELARLSVAVGQIATEEEFVHVQKIFDIVKQRERTSIPPVEINSTKYRGRMLSPDDVLNMFAGNITTCCQRFGDVGEGAMLLGSIEENAGIFVVEEIGKDGKSNIVGQSLVIRQKGKDGANDRLCFDNIEIVENALEKMSSEEHTEILEIYKQAGKKAIETDKKFLGKLLNDGKINQEIYDRLVLKEVIAGQGYNDLEGLEDLPDADIVVPDEAYYKYVTYNAQKKHPWIDSTGGKTPEGSNGTPVELAAMDEKDLQEIEKRRKNGYSEVKLSDVPLWYGKVGNVRIFNDETLKSRQVETIKQIERQAYREEQQLLNAEDVQDIEDIEYCYEIENVQIAIGSNNDWYLVYGENEEQIVISDLAVAGAINSDSKSSKPNEVKGNIKLATAEAADTLYELLINAGKDEKTIYCNATKDTSLINIKRMLSKGLIKTFDEDGQELIYDKQKGLAYADNGTEVEYRDFSSEGDIQMLDLIIEPDVEKLIQEKEKISKLLLKVQNWERMQGREKEEGLDDLRRTIREDLENDGR